MRPPKNLAKNVPVGSVAGRKTKKGSSTPKAKTKRSTARFFEVKIRITAEEYARGQPYFQGQRHLSRFALDAFREKLNRAEANDKAARLRILAGNMELLEPVLKEMYAQGKLAFLKEQADG
jgi:hypothetical protein